MKSIIQKGITTGVILHPTKQDYDILIDLKFGRDSNWHETIENTKFQKINCSIRGDTVSSNLSFREGTINEWCSDIHLQKSGLMMTKSLFHDQKWFP